MGDEFLTALADTANTLIEMLGDCDLPIVEYVTSQVTDNGYVFLDDLQKLDNEGDL